MVSKSMTIDTITNTNFFQLISASREGIGIDEFTELTSRYPLQTSDWSRLINISERTIQRYKREHKKLNPIHSEKLLWLILLFKKGVEIFGNTENFFTWINTKNIALGGIQPINLIDNIFGINMVTDELTRIEHGILS